MDLRDDRYRCPGLGSRQGRTLAGQAGADDQNVMGRHVSRFYLGGLTGAFWLDWPLVRRLPTEISGPVLIEPTVHGDQRGFFLETYRRSLLAEFGIDDDFVQDNHSRSRQGVVRGMHFQPGMAKLVRCARGSIYDVVVDLRRGSPTFGRWEGFELNDTEHHQLYCPDGFAHGFCVLSDVADVVYMTTAYYDPARESGFVYNDSHVAIAWPAALELTASARDSGAPTLAEIAEGLPFEYAA
jgi:dTDP-4-dehydrorhamnose 3,5-epimerase